MKQFIICAVMCLAYDQTTIAQVPFFRIFRSYVKCQIIGTNDLLDQQEVAFSNVIYLGSGLSAGKIVVYFK